MWVTNCRWHSSHHCCPYHTHHYASTYTHTLSLSLCVYKILCMLHTRLYEYRNTHIDAHMLTWIHVCTRSGSHIKSNEILLVEPFLKERRMIIRWTTTNTLFSVGVKHWTLQPGVQTIYSIRLLPPMSLQLWYTKMQSFVCSWVQVSSFATVNIFF